MSTLNCCCPNCNGIHNSILFPTETQSLQELYSPEDNVSHSSALWNDFAESQSRMQLYCKLERTGFNVILLILLD